MRKTTEFEELLFETARWEGSHNPFVMDLLAFYIDDKLDLLVHVVDNSRETLSLEELIMYNKKGIDAKILEILAEHVACGLEFLHNEEILQGFRPSTVFVGPNGAAQIARVIDGSENKDEKDIFSFGVMLWSAFTGKHDFKRDEIDPSGIPAQSSWVVPVVEACTSAVPSERPTD